VKVRKGRSGKSGKTALRRTRSEKRQETRRPPISAYQAPHETSVELADLPGSQGPTKVVLLPVDPYLAHVYWHVAPQDLKKTQREAVEKAHQAHAALRFYEVSGGAVGGANANSRFDVDVDLAVGNWYVHLWSAHKAYCVELGFPTEGNGFIPLARSKVVESPRVEPSLNFSEQFTLVTRDYRHVERIDLSPSPEKGLQFGFQETGGQKERSRQRNYSPAIHGSPQTTALGPAPDAGAYEEHKTKSQGRGGVAEQGLSIPSNAQEVLKRKLAEFHDLRKWADLAAAPESAQSATGRSPTAREHVPDLTEISERSFVHGVSSKGSSR
jgi:hypothetical protein